MSKAIREVRFTSSQLRAKKGAGLGIEGHGAVFNQLSQDLGGWRERIMPGAFTRNLATQPDVRALFNHDPNQVLGRTKAKTLRLKEDDIGLHYDVDLPDTQIARDVHTSIDRGDVDQSSFGFFVREQKWSEEPDPADATGKATMIVREVHDADLSDVSPVTYPAYLGADVDTRSLFPDGIPQEIRTHVPQLDRRAAVKTKRVDGVEYQARSFAYVGDPNDTATWRFLYAADDPKISAKHVRAAIEAYQLTDGVPAEARDGVLTKLLGAAEVLKVDFPKSLLIRKDKKDDSDDDDDNDNDGDQDEECDCRCEKCADDQHDECTADERCALAERSKKRSAPVEIDREKMKLRLKLSETA